MATHTPGPWELGPIIRSTLPTPHMVYQHVFGKGRKLASVSVYGHDRDGKTGGRRTKRGDAVRTITEAEATANANLIAEAPELLELCKDMLDGSERDAVWYRKLAAAIAKAEGER